MRTSITALEMRRRRPANEDASHTHSSRGKEAIATCSWVSPSFQSRVDLATLRHSSGIDSAPQPQPHASLAPWCQTKLAVQRFLRSDAQAAGDGVAYTSEITCGIITFRPKKFFSNSFLDLRASIFVINHARVFMIIIYRESADWCDRSS